jgi:hypothetical protein
MTLTERRAQLADRLQEMRNAHARLRDSLAQLGSQIDQLSGAIQMLDQLIAEEGNSHASGEQIATTPDGNEVRAGEGVEERES